MLRVKIISSEIAKLSKQELKKWLDYNPEEHWIIASPTKRKLEVLRDYLITQGYEVRETKGAIYGPSPLYLEALIGLRDYLKENGIDDV